MSTTAEPIQVKSPGTLGTIRHTPGWVWIVIGGIVLLIVGLLAARATIPTQKDFEL
jgi:hypothetical protein